MKLKKKHLEESLLYVIVNEDIKTAEKALCAGADIIQLRIKNKDDKSITDTARKLRKLADRYKAFFLINDRVDIAAIAGADGVHLGAKDISIADARRVLGSKYIIGSTTHCQSEAKKSISQGADYIAVGPVFKTFTKPKLKPLRLQRALKIIEESTVPCFAIGGINLKNLDELIDKGINRIAVYQAVIKAKRPGFAAAKIKGILLNYENAHRKNKKRPTAAHS